MDKENAENENCILQGENVELWDRIEVLESILQANSHAEYDDYDWRKIIEEEQASSLVIPKAYSKGVETVARTLMEMKKENRMLKIRVEHLEIQNNDLSLKFGWIGNIEPTWTLKNWTEDVVDISDYSGVSKKQSDLKDVIQR